MTDLYRSTVVWTGFAGSPATTTLYTTAIPVTSGIKAFFTAIKALVPSTVQWAIRGSGDTINDANGELTGGWSTGADLSEVGGAAGANYSAPSGIVVRLTTSTIVAGRRVKGRIFVVPTIGTVFDSNGTITTANLATLQTAASSLVSSQAGTLAVWARPFPGRPAEGSRPARPARSGSTALVTGATVPDMAAVLRSRRD